MNLQDLPLMNTVLPRLAAVYKQHTSDFQVVEIPLYEPSGVGSHYYAQIQRSGQNTRDIIKQLAQRLPCSARDIGYAGLKDRQALTTQWFSFPESVETTQIEQAVLQISEAQLLALKRHDTKLKRGHLLGNQFKILLRSSDPEAVGKLQAIIDFLFLRPIPNFFGEQRFGRFGDNAELGCQLLLGKKRRKDWKASLLVSAYQSQLFNQWLKERIQRGHFEQLYLGDVAKKWDTGGLFWVRELLVDQQRYSNGEITYTGPIFGHKMRAAEAEAGLNEAAIWEQQEVPAENLKLHRVQGSRRPAQIKISDWRITPALEEGVWVEFSLPKGSYATVVLRELILPSV